MTASWEQRPYHYMYCILVYENCCIGKTNYFIVLWVYTFIHVFLGSVISLYHLNNKKANKFSQISHTGSLKIWSFLCWVKVTLRQSLVLKVHHALVCALSIITAEKPAFHYECMFKYYQRRIRLQLQAASWASGVSFLSLPGSHVASFGLIWNEGVFFMSIDCCCFQKNVHAFS